MGSMGMPPFTSHVSSFTVHLWGSFAGGLGTTSWLGTNGLVADTYEPPQPQVTQAALGHAGRQGLAHHQTACIYMMDVRFILDARLRLASVLLDSLRQMPCSVQGSMAGAAVTSSNHSLRQGSSIIMEP